MAKDCWDENRLTYLDHSKMQSVNSIDNLAHVNCYNCGSSVCTPYDDENGFTIVKCGKCGLLYLNPRPRDELVSEAARTGKHEGCRILDVTGAYLPAKERRYEGILGEIFNNKSIQGDWLDIGCGCGEFMSALTRFSNGSLRVTGVEPNEGKLDAGRKMGLNIVASLSIVSGRLFNFVSALNVYSHLPDPVGTIAQWGNLLAPGGSLLIETGDTCNLPAWRHPKPYSLPDHLSFASSEIVSDILQRVGFTVVRCVRKSPYPDLNLAYVGRQLIKAFIPGQRCNAGWLPGKSARDTWLLATKRSK